MECKVGASFSQRVVVSKDRGCLMDKKSYASIEGVEGSWSKDVEEREKIVGVMTYVRSNLDWIENIAKVKGYGMGPVEKTVDIAVARRFKKRGKSWYWRVPILFSN